jgi:hypothetical protein
LAHAALIDPKKNIMAQRANAIEHRRVQDDLRRAIQQ